MAKILYKAIQFRSLLEARTAFILDYLGIEWKYEIEKYILNTGESYIPDFFIGNKLLIECKGEIDNQQLFFHQKVSRELKKDLLLLSYDKLYFFDGTTEYIPKIKEDGENWEDNFQILECNKCKKKSFITSYGSFYCRLCDEYNGDHDIQDDFSNIKGLKDIYDKYEVKWLKP